MQIARSGYFELGGHRPDKYMIENAHELGKEIKGNAAVQDVMARVFFSGLLNNGRSDQPIIGEGVEPERENKLGSGMVICPKGLLEELDRTLAMKSDLGVLRISKGAHVVFPYHRMLDRLEEDARGENKIGTTSRGIGPAYQDKVARFGIRMGEFVRPDVFRTRLREVLGYKNRLLEMFGEAPVEFDPLFDEYAKYADRLRPYVDDTDVFLQEAVRTGQKVLFEGAQGAMLDLDSGTYPYVTSSHPVAGGACLGTGVGPRDIDSVLGVCKAYATRVGEGPFPTELQDEIGERIRTVGREFGTTTGRPRRCGWLDLVVLRQSCRMNSLSGLILTRLDIFSGFESMQVATGYLLDGQPLGHVPGDTCDMGRVVPVYETLPGWSEGVRGARTLEELPQNAREYIAFIERFTETPVAMVSVGPDRAETMVLRPDLLWG
jgi:adenylosuccinate synthase